MKPDARRPGRGVSAALLIVGTVVLLAALPWLVSAYFVSVMNSMLIQAVIGLGMMVVVGYSGQVSIGHAAFVAVGAYGEAILIQNGVPFPVSLVLVAILCFVFGFLVGLPALRFSGLYLAMATLAFSFVVEAVIGGLDITGGRGGMSVDDLMVLGWRAGSDLWMYYIALFVIVVAFFIVANLVTARTGRAWVAIRESEIAAASMGIDVALYKTLAFAISAALAGIGGTLLAHKIGYLSPDAFTIQQSIEMLILVVVGGLGSLGGVVFGTVFMTVIPVLLSIFRDQLPQVVRELPGLVTGFFGVALILVVLFQPEGINGGFRNALAFLKAAVRRSDKQQVPTP